MIRRIFLLGIVLVYWLVAGLYAVRVPDWQTPDEPAHYNYIRQIAIGVGVPVIEMGDWDQAYLDELRSNRFDPALLDDIDDIQYEDHQPPLYYLLAAPLYGLTDGSLTALRLFSVVIGTLIIIGAYGVGRLMFPKRPWIAVAVAAFVAFQPQHVHIIASVNNDVLAWAIVAWALLATIAYLKHEVVFGLYIRPWTLGVLVGIGLVTKSTTYFMAGVVLVALVLRWQSERDPETSSWRDLPSILLPYLAPALAFGLLWWGRNIIVYGFPDFLGLAAHDAVVVGQPRTAELIERIGWGGYLREITTVTFNSFWAQFGWMGVPLGSRTYGAIQALLVFAFIGLALEMAILRRGMPPIPREQRNAWVILGLTTVLAILAFLYYNTEFQQHQGRYMFTLLIPLGLWLALGLDAWRELVVDRLVRSRQQLWLYTPWLVPAVFCLLAVWDIWLLWRVVVPNLQVI